MFKSDMKDSLRNKVYTSIISDLISGVYSPLEIINESELIDKYHVSKSPVRDALIELCKENILVSMPRVGYRLAYYTDSWFQSVTEFRACVEPAYLKKNWEKLTDEKINKIEETQKIDCIQDDSITSNVIEHWLRNQAFHLSIAETWEDPYFYEILQNTLKRLTIAYAQYYWNRWKNASFPLNVSMHTKLIQAMRENNVEDAVYYLTRDIYNFEH